MSEKPPEKRLPEDLTENTPFTKALSERYLAYALSTIMSRSLPDVRDGLKPVHRRLIFAMHQLKLNPQSGFKKCARVVGDVIGKYHPHGDAAVYETLVRLAQDFTVRYPLIEGQGNFGNIDGDNAAAMRYTEARLSEIAEAMLAGIHLDSVDLQSTYDGEEEEPVVLPGAFPNLLANGASGIAVGMATGIPPHNVGEIIAALIYLINHEAAETKDLLRFMPGPDFPTGGIIVDKPEILQNAYETGRGSVRVRAKYETERKPGGLFQVVVTELPWQTNKSKLIADIATAMEQKKLPLVADIRDESDEAIRVVIEPKTRAVDPEVMMESLFRIGAFENRISINMNVLDGGRFPKVMSLKQILSCFVAHRHEVWQRQAKFKLAGIANRLEILTGYLVVFLNLDEVIAIIREEDDPKKALAARFGLTDVQTEAVLNMRLRSLRKLEEEGILQEKESLLGQQKEMTQILADEAFRKSKIIMEFKEIGKKFGKGPLGTRRTAFGKIPEIDLLPAEALTEREPLTLILSEKGWLRAIKGHITETESLKFKEDDRLGFLLHCQSTDKAAFFCTDGRSYTLPVQDIPKGRGDGQAVRLLIRLEGDVGIVAVFIPDPQQKYLVISESGRGFFTSGENFQAEKRTGKNILTLKSDEKAFACLPCFGDSLAIIGENRRLLIFPHHEIPEMVKGQGVILQKYREGRISDAKFMLKDQGLSWSVSGKTKTVSADEWWGHRGHPGRMVIYGFPRSGKFNG